MEGDLASLKIHRRQLKSCLTRTEKFLDKSEASLQPEQIKVRHEKFAYCYDEFNRIQSKIEEIDETELDTNEREDFEERYFDFEARFRKMLSLTLNNANQTATQSSVSKMIKLPTIDLPRFSGNYEDWMSFYDTFNSLIHKDKDLPLVQKFHYLKSCLKGDAASILHSLEISADNYNNAWQMLQDRYSNQRVIVQKHINSIFELPTAVKENLKTLRHILDGVLKHTRTLAALKRPTQYWDDLLVVIITKKLDPTTYKEWESKIKCAELPTIEELISFLTQKCQTLEAIAKPQTNNTLNNTYNHVTILQELNKNVSIFKEIKRFPEKPIYTQEERHCEQHFERTAEGDSQGRFIVALPFKENLLSLGKSYEQAEKRFQSLERKLNRNPRLKHQYCDFMKEYLELGHMRPVTGPVNLTIPYFYLPHHAVIKESSVTTKLRVVFDGSAKTSSGVSLNDTLMVGPKLQQDLFDIVCRFHLHKFVLTADVTKMYRQIRMNKECMPYQRILWRMSERDQLLMYELTTVTYGTAPASYLAVKALQQLAIAEQSVNKLGAQIMLRDFYVDDLLTGADYVKTVSKIALEVITILSKGGLELRKWTSNSPEILEGIPGSSNPDTILDLDKGDGINTLGIQWNTIADSLQYALSEIPEPNLTHLKSNTLSRWQHIQCIREHFWRRWQKEYLNQLQRRNKWKTSNTPGVLPGRLVIIQEDNTPPCNWIMGRVIQTFPGADAVVRTATVQTIKGVMQRPVRKLCVLPVEHMDHAATTPSDDPSVTSSDDSSVTSSDDPSVTSSDDPPVTSSEEESAAAPVDPIVTSPDQQPTITSSNAGIRDIVKVRV